MQHLILRCLIAGSFFSAASASAIMAVPVPEKPTVKLPTPHGHTGAAEPISCKRLDACLAEGGAEDKDQSKLKSCIQNFCEDLHRRNVMNMTESRRALCDNKGEKVWGILAKASKGKKASLVALKIDNPVTYAAVLQALLAQSSTVNEVADACRVEPVPVPEKPTVKLPTPHGHTGAVEPVSCLKLDECLAQAGTEDKEKSKLKSCIQSFCEDLHSRNVMDKTESRRALCDNKGKKVWDIVARESKGKKASLVALKGYVFQALLSQSTTVSQVADACRLQGDGAASRSLRGQPVVKEPAPSKPIMKSTAPHAPPKVAVPAKPTVALPKPHGLHSTESPMLCKKLDMCLADAGAEDQKKSASEFKACIQSFCEDLHGNKNLKKKDDDRTALCDKKGKEAWDIISKAGAFAKKNKKPSLVALRSYRPDTYAAVLKILFAQSSTATSEGALIWMTDACQVNAVRPVFLALGSSGTPAPGCDGTVFNILKEGSGKEVTKGSKVTVHATGVVKESGKKFWSTKDPGQQAFSYQAGVGQVIKGWDQGLLGMKLGEERQVIIVGKEGYGEAGFPAWGIPANATLDFTLEVLKIE